MNWYIAKIIFRIAEHQETNAQFDEQLKLIEAESQEEAFLKARIIGIRDEEMFINKDNHQSQWEFINVPEVILLESREDGAEVYSRSYEIEDEKKYIHSIHQKANALRLASYAYQ